MFAMDIFVYWVEANEQRVFPKVLSLVPIQVPYKKGWESTAEVPSAQCFPQPG